MKKIYKLENLDCANCAAKMEVLINKIEGVNVATVNFMSQRLTIDLEEENKDKIMEEVLKACRKVEKDIIIK